MSRTRNDERQKIQIILVGDPRVGKSAMLSQWKHGQFPDAYHQTIGVDFAKKAIDQGNYFILDLAGDKRFREIVEPYIRSSHLIILVYDATDRDSFNAIENEWYSFVRKTQRKMSPIILVANKSDKDLQKNVSKEEGEALAAKLGADFFEISAKSKEDVNDLFDNAYNKVLAARVESQDLLNKNMSKSARQPSFLKRNLPGILVGIGFAVALGALAAVFWPAIVGAAVVGGAAAFVSANLFAVSAPVVAGVATAAIGIASSVVVGWSAQQVSNVIADIKKTNKAPAYIRNKGSTAVARTRLEKELSPGKRNKSKSGSRSENKSGLDRSGLSSSKGDNKSSKDPAQEEQPPSIKKSSSKITKS